MKNVLGVLMAALLVLAIVPAAFAETVPTGDMQVEAGFPIEIGVTPTNNCPVIVQEECSDWGEIFQTQMQSSVCYFVDTFSMWADQEGTLADLAFASGFSGRSYAFEGETINFKVVVRDDDGIIDDCVKVAVTLDNGVDPIKAGCTLVDTEPSFDNIPGGDNQVINGEAFGVFLCTYTVEAADQVSGEYWVSVQTSDRTCSAEGGCTQKAAGVISLYLNPEVSLTLAAQDEMGFAYDVNGEETEVKAGSTVYSPYFTVENTADPQSGLYIFLKLYGTDMKSGSAGAKCPYTNVLDITNVEYKASHLNAQQPWTPIVDGTYHPENAWYVFTQPTTMGANFLGVGDDVTMRMRLNVPSPCVGAYTNGGKIVFVGQVI